MTLIQTKWSFKLVLAALFVIFLESAFAWKPAASQPKVLLSEIDTLTLYSDRTTAYQRTVYPSTCLIVETVSAVNLCWWGCEEILETSGSDAM